MIQKPMLAEEVHAHALRASENRKEDGGEIYKKRGICGCSRKS